MISTRSKDDLEKAKRCAELLYGNADAITTDMIAGLVDELPLIKVPRDAAMKGSLPDLLVKMEFAESTSSGRNDV